MSLADKSFKKLRKTVAKRHVQTATDYEQLQKEVYDKFYEKQEKSDVPFVQITAGKAKNVKLEVPRSAKTMTSRLKISMFDFLGIDIQKTRILDLYAGAGAFGFEALSRGASEATFIDSSKFAQYSLEKNAQRAGFVMESTILREKAEFFLERELDNKEAIFDVVFMDPPYKLFNSKKITHMESIINRIKLFLPYFRGEDKQFKGLIIVKHPSTYPMNKLILEQLRIVETKKFGKNSLSFIIVQL